MSKYENERRGRVPDDKVEELASLYQSFSDPTRLRIMMLLMEEESSVGEIARALDMSDSAISHQLKYLKQMRLVKSRRAGRFIIYALLDEHVRQLIWQGLEHVYE